MRKELPSPEFDSGKLFMLPYEALKWELLKTAIELNVFDYTSAPVTATTVSVSLSLHPGNTEYILNALVALGCLKKENDHYRNTAQSEQFLTQGKDTSLGESLLFMSSWTLPVLNGGLKEMVKNGPPPKKDMADPEIWEKGARVSVNHSRCGRAQMIAGHVSTLPEFPSFTKILDLGAGPGILGIAVTATHSTLKCVLFDQPAVSKVAKEVVAEYGMEDRVDVVGGDYMQDDFGTGYEFIMANFTLNFYRDRLDEVLCKVFASLKPGGVFMVTSDGLNHDKTGPAGSVISWLPTMLQGNDMSFGTGQIARKMLEAGFVSTEQKTLTDIELEAHGPVEMTIGRKGTES